MTLIILRIIRYIYVYTTVYCGPLPAGKVSVITRNTGDAKLNTLTAPNTLNTTNPAFHAFENVSDSIASFSGPGGGGGRSKSISSSSSSTRARHGKVLCFLLLLEVGLDFGDAMLIFPIEREKDDRDLDDAFFANFAFLMLISTSATRTAPRSSASRAGRPWR